MLLGLPAGDGVKEAARPPAFQQKPSARAELKQTQGGEYDRHERHSCAVEAAAAPLRWLLLRNQRRGFIR